MAKSNLNHRKLQIALLLEVNLENGGVVSYNVCEISLNQQEIIEKENLDAYKYSGITKNLCHQ